MSIEGWDPTKNKETGVEEFNNTEVNTSSEVIRILIKQMVLDAFENGYWRGQDQRNDKSTMWIHSETKIKLEEFLGEEWIDLKGPF